jgi:flagellar FliL protein
MSLGNNKYSDDELQLQPISTSSGSSPELEDQFKSVKGKRLIVIIGSILAIALLMGIYLYFRSPADTVSSSQKLSDTPKANTNSYFFELPEITTNLAPNNDKESWIKFAMTLQLENSKDQDALDKKIPMIKDSIIVFLREIRSSDLASSGGSMMLKTELLKRINKIMYPIILKDILFREILLDQ